MILKAMASRRVLLKHATKCYAFLNRRPRMADVAQKTTVRHRVQRAKEHEIFVNKNSMLYKINTVS